jgi:hypothetical protein
VTADDVAVGAAVVGSDEDVMAADVMAADVMAADVPDDVVSGRAIVVVVGAIVLVMGAVLCAPVLVAVL